MCGLVFSSRLREKQMQVSGVLFLCSSLLPRLTNSSCFSFLHIKFCLPDSLFMFYSCSPPSSVNQSMLPGSKSGYCAAAYQVGYSFRGVHSPVLPVEEYLKTVISYNLSSLLVAFQLEGKSTPVPLAWQNGSQWLLSIILLSLVI